MLATALRTTRVPLTKLTFGGDYTVLEPVTVSHDMVAVDIVDMDTRVPGAILLAGFLCKMPELHKVSVDGMPSAENYCDAVKGFVNAERERERWRWDGKGPLPAEL